MKGLHFSIVSKARSSKSRGARESVIVAYTFSYSDFR